MAARADGQFDIVYESPLIEPNPFPKLGYERLASSARGSHATDFQTSFRDAALVNPGLQQPVVTMLSLMAIGLAIVFGLMGVINMAHGELMALGAYMTYLTSSLLRPLFACV